MKIPAIISVILTMLTFTADAITIYVKPNGTGNGTSWTNATSSLTQALSAASAGDQVWVAQGTYKASLTGNQDTSFYLKDGVAIYGGFTGMETLLTQRADTSGTATILSGDLGGGLRSRYIVKAAASVTGTAILDGFTISGASNSVTGSDTSGGAGMYNYGSPRLSHLIFENNVVSILVPNLSWSYIGGGAGMYNYLGSPILQWVIFRNNRVLINSPMNPSRIGGGGGLLLNGGAPQMTNVSFISNKVTVNGNSGYGGGMYALNNAVPEITNAVFSGNAIRSTGTSIAANSGGGIYIGGSAAIPIKLTNILFEKDSANDGTALYISNSQVILTNATFHGNTQYGLPYEIDIYSSYSNTTINNCVIDGNLLAYGTTVTVNSSLIANTPQGSYTAANSFFGPVKFVGASQGNYMLLPCSSGINAGDDSKNGIPTDLNGHPRKYGNIDMGAFELQVPAVLADTLFVNSGKKVTSTDGRSWATAFPDLQTALLYNCNGTYARNIWVAQGTYKPSVTGAANESFALHSNMRLFGGFAGNETKLDQRDSTGATRVTVLSGELQDDNDSTNNTKNVVYIDNADSTAELNGFTIRDGYGGRANSGAGIYCINSNAILRNLVITHNSGTLIAGGMCILNSGIKLSNSRFLDNASGTGGGLYAVNASIYGTVFRHPQLNHVVFENNTAGLGGGGLHNRETDMALTDVTFTGNKAIHYGGGMMSETGSVILKHVMFKDNLVTDLAPVANSGGGLYINGNGNIVLSDVLFANNKANYGGGAYIQMTTGTTTFINTTFAGNTAHISGNTAYHYEGELRLRNCILDTTANNNGDIRSLYSPSSISISSSLFRGGFPPLFINGGNNLLYKDPMFTDAAGGDYSLMPCSPAINAGNNTFIYAGNTTDLAGNPRRYSGWIVDLGPYEYQGQQTLPLIITRQPADTPAYAGGVAIFTIGTTGTAVTYQWQVSTDGGLTWNNAGINSTGSILTVSPVTAVMGSYLYRCLVKGCPSPVNSNTARIIVKPGNSVVLIGSGQAALTAYPNPTTGITTLKMELQQQARGAVEVADVTGRKIYSKPVNLQQGENQVTLDLAAIANGLYHITLLLREPGHEPVRAGTVRLLKQD